MTVLGLCMVAMIFIVLFGYVDGLKQTILNGSGDRNWILLSRGAQDEGQSAVTYDEIEMVSVRPEIAVDSNGRPLISRELLQGVNISRDKHVRRFVLLRGATPNAYEVHRGMHLVSGRWPARGQVEWVIGQKVYAREPYLKPGTSFHYGRQNWTIAGIFSDNDSARESEIWTDYEDLLVDGRYPSDIANSLHVVLKPGTAEAFKQALKSDGRLNFDVLSEREYYAEQSRVIDQLRSLGLIVALTLGIGATFGGMYTMFAAVARRKREIGVLRVLGFSPGSIVNSFVAESAVLGVAGGITGALLAYLTAWGTGLNSRLLSVGSTYFSYQSTVVAVLAGITASALIGILGGLAPAWRAAHMGVVESLRDP